MLASGDSNPRNAQLALNLLVAGERDEQLDLADAWQRHSQRLFKLLKGPTEGLSEGLRERLYEWARPHKKRADSD
jgi:hypothetical protein